MDFYFVYTGLTSILLLLHICYKGSLSQPWNRGHGRQPICSGTCLLPYRVCLRLARQSQKTNLCEGYYDHPRFQRLFGIQHRRRSRGHPRGHIGQPRRTRGQPRTRTNRGRAAQAPIQTPSITHNRRFESTQNVLDWNPVHVHDVTYWQGPGVTSRPMSVSTPFPHIQLRTPTTPQRLTTQEPERHRAIRKVLKGYHNVMLQRGSRVSDVTIRPPARTITRSETQRTTPSSSTLPSIKHNVAKTRRSEIKAIKDKLGLHPNSTAIRSAVLALHNILLQRSRSRIHDLNITSGTDHTVEPDNQTTVEEGWKMSQHLLEMLKLEVVQLPQANLTETGANVACDSCSDNADCEEGKYCYHSTWCGKQTCQTLHA